MTAIAWAIVFIGLIFYGEIYLERLTKLKLTDTLSGLTIFSLGILIVCTIRELLR